MTADKDQHEELEQEIVDYKQQWIRAQADYQNLQKEVSKQRAIWGCTAREEVLEDVIPVLENFKKAFDHDTTEDRESFENWKKGIGFIQKQLSDLLARYDVEPIATVGETFDPLLHEAVGEEASEEYVEGTVIGEVEGGYKVGDRVLRAAKVTVSK